MQPSAIIDAIPWTMPAVSNALSAAFRAFSQVAAPMIATAFWQGLVVASGLAICLRLAPRMPAAQRFTVWAAGFATLVALPFVPLLSHLSVAASSSVSIGAAGTSTKPWLQLDMRWSLALAALWFAVSAFRAADLAIHSFRLRRLWKAATPVEPCISGTSLQAGMRGRMQVQLCTTQALDRPSVIGFFAPRVLIPAWLLAQLTPEELQQVVMHEAEHLRRGDDWTNLFQKLCLVLFPLNPALWWIERRLCQEREMACDEGVVRVTRAPRAYAACLANLAERGLQHRAEALSLGAWQRRPELVQRVHRILQRRNALNPLAARTLLGVLGCGLLFSSVELARCPQLVTFVPAHNADSALAVETTHAQAAPTRFINAAYKPGRHDTASALGLHATQAKATVADISQSRGESKPQIATEWKPSSLPLASGSPQQMLKTTFTRSQSDSADEQQWIVLTAWQQVETVNPTLRPSADYDTGESADSMTAPATEQPNGRVTEQITVTRLIFKVLPAGSLSAQPVAVPVRNGWFVIQL